jgi:hypothetical protein
MEKLEKFNKNMYNKTKKNLWRTETKTKDFGCLS